MSTEGSEAETKRCIHSFCQALATRNLNRVQSLLAGKASLFWGPYGFDGGESISAWAKELFELFPFLSFKEKSLQVQGNVAKHELMIAFLTQDGQKGWLPCVADYEFEDGKIRQLKVSLLHGFLAVDREDVERVKPHEPRKQQ